MRLQNRFALRCTPIAVCLLVWALSLSVAVAQPGLNQRESLAPDRVLVAFQPGTSEAEIGLAHSQAGGKVIKRMDAIGIQVVAVPAGTVQKAIGHYRSNSSVRFAEPNYRRPLFRPVTTEGSEPALGIQNNFDEQWGLHNTGQSFGATIDPLFGTLTFPAYTGVADADIDAPEGWALTLGNPAIKIAIQPGHDRRHALDFSRISGELGWYSKIAFEKGLRMTIEWYEPNPKWIALAPSGEFQGHYHRVYGPRAAANYTD